MKFEVDNVPYELIHCKPNTRARYGLALTYWYTNLTDLMFTLEFMRNWTNRHLIEVSICSTVEVPLRHQHEVEEQVNYISYTQWELGQQDGTTANCNGALSHLYNNDYLKVIAHTDTDQIIINPAYFFGHSNMLLDSGKVILTYQQMYKYDKEKMQRSVYPGYEEWTHKLGSTFYLNTGRLKKDNKNYFPFRRMGHYEIDRYTQFLVAGYSIDKDAIILPRLPHRHEPIEAIDLDLHMGLQHYVNDLGDKDKRYKMLRALCIDKWQDMVKFKYIGRDDVNRLHPEGKDVWESC